MERYFKTTSNLTFLKLIFYPLDKTHFENGSSFKVQMQGDALLFMSTCVMICMNLLIIVSNYFKDDLQQRAINRVTEL